MVKVYQCTSKTLPFLSFSFCILKASGADALELNLSCPHGMGERGMGLACGQVRTSTAVMMCGCVAEQAFIQVVTIPKARRCVDQMTGLRLPGLHCLNI